MKYNSIGSIIDLLAPPLIFDLLPFSQVVLAAIRAMLRVIVNGFFCDLNTSEIER